jgi:hypothetical protein
MERGEAPEAMLKYYARWLATMEQWSVEECEIQYMAARVGRRFVGGWVSATRRLK